MAATPRAFGGTTRMSAMTTDIATVEWPLGKLLPAVTRSGSTPRSGR
jgi:hypothetical protein